MSSANTTKPVKELYDITPEFERALVTLVSSRPRFWGRIGTELDVECLHTEPAKLALRATRAIALERGAGPNSLVVVLQRLRRWMGEGKYTEADLIAVSDMFDAAEDYGLPHEDDVIAELAPILRRRLERASIQGALSEFQKNGDPSKALNMLERARKLGTLDDSVGVIVGPGSFDEIEAMATLVRLSTGIMELDDALGGGYVRGTETVYIGSSGAGKSLALVGAGCAGALQGCNVGYATLELPVPLVLARAKAYLTGIPTNDIINPRSKGYASAKIEIERIRSRTRYGSFTCKAFPPEVTTIADIKAWVKWWEEHHGRQMHMLCLDYADKCAAPASATRKDESSYKAQGSVYEEFRYWMEETKRWGITASQSSRTKEKPGKILDLDDVADSLNKIRVADKVITINPRDDHEQTIYFIAKNRYGVPRLKVGPLPVAMGCARMGPVDATMFDRIDPETRAVLASIFGDEDAARVALS